MRIKSLIIATSVCVVLGFCQSSFAADTMDPIYASLRMLWGLLIVSALILIIYWILRKRLNILKTTESKHIKIIEVRHIMPKKSLMLIEVRGHEYLVGTGNDSISTITPLVKPSSFATCLQETEETSSNDVL